MMPTEDEIMAAQTAKGGWTRDTLASWGVPWPPPKGWKRRLLAEAVAGTYEVHDFTTIDMNAALDRLLRDYGV